MGRGRAKAKQTKVARELKYSSPTTDFDALQQELGGGGDGFGRRASDDEEHADSRRSEYSYDER